MKKIINFLPAVAILLASGLAVATTSKVNDPNVYWNGSSWQSIPSGVQYNCDESSLQFCTAFMDEHGNVDEEDINKGNRIEL